MAKVISLDAHRTKRSAKNAVSLTALECPVTIDDSVACYVALDDPDVVGVALMLPTLPKGSRGYLLSPAAAIRLASTLLADASSLMAEDDEKP